MLAQRLRLLSLVALAGCCSLLWLSSSTAEEERTGPNHARLANAAKEAFDAVEEAYEAGHVTLDDMHQWSRRLMEAELRADAAAKRPRLDHARRMQALHEKVAAQHRVGLVGLLELRMTEYYVAAAEFELGL